MAQKIQAPKGTQDVLPEQIHKWHFLEEKARETARDFGYGEIRFPVFEHTELFHRGVGETTDIVQKEMYTFLDKGGRSITLRPEGTASVVRALVEHSVLQKGLPVKAYYIVPNYRYEKPQAGRFREHHQFGVECFGPAGPDADAEVISLGSTLLQRLEIKNVRLKINSIGCPDCRPDYHAALKSYFEAQKDSLCPTCRERLLKNPLRILDCKEEACSSIAKDAPHTFDHLCPPCEEHFSGLEARLLSAGITFQRDSRIVRGLDYYTRTVFEFVSDAIGAKGTVLGGGRYDGLVGTLSGPETPALGFGSGIERLILQMEAEGVAPAPASGPRVFLAAADDGSRPMIFPLLNELRAIGVPAETDLMGRSLKAQMKYASKIGASYTAVIGEDELQKKVCKLRDMALSEEFSSELNAAEISERIAEYERRNGETK